MSMMVFSRTAIVPVWLVVLTLFVLFGQTTSATAVLVLLVGVVIPMIVLSMWKTSTPTVAEVVRHVDWPRARERDSARRIAS